LIVGLNCPPITDGFHWCRSSLTYQINFNSEELYYGKHLSDDEYESINKYLKSYSYKINSTLYNQGGLTKEQEKYIEELDFALSKMPKYTGNVFRSVYVKDNEQLNKILSVFNNNSKIGSWNSYISSSKGIYDESFNLQFKIKSKTGRNLSKLNDEGKGEIVFLRNTQFELKDIYSLNGNIIVSLEEV